MHRCLPSCWGWTGEAGHDAQHCPPRMLCFPSPPPPPQKKGAHKTQSTAAAPAVQQLPVSCPALCSGELGCSWKAAQSTCWASPSTASIPKSRVSPWIQAGEANTSKHQAVCTSGTDAHRAPAGTGSSTPRDSFAELPRRFVSQLLKQNPLTLPECSSLLRMRSIFKSFSFTNDVVFLCGLG